MIYVAYPVFGKVHCLHNNVFSVKFSFKIVFGKDIILVPIFWSYS